MSQRFKSHTFPLDFGLYLPYLYVKKNYGGYLYLRLEPEPMKLHIWKIFCLPRSPTLLIALYKILLSLCLEPEVQRCKCKWILSSATLFREHLFIENNVKKIQIFFPKQCTVVHLDGKVSTHFACYSYQMTPIQNLKKRYWQFYD